MSVLVCFRPVCPSGDGGVLESCSSLSPLDPLPYSTWPFIYSASLEGERNDLFPLNLGPAGRFVTVSSLPLSPKGLCCHSALWKDQFRETTGAVRAVLPAPHTSWYTKGNGKKHARVTFDRPPLSFYSPLPRQTLDEMKLEIKPIKIDRRLTGSSFIDEPLQQVCLSL